MPDNEGKVCDAVVKCLERQTGRSRRHIRCPDKEGGDPPVELRLKLGAEGYAIEHTRMESFRNQVGTGIHLTALAESVQYALGEKLPGPALYEMKFPLNPRLGVKRAALQRSQDNLVNWVKEQANRLYRSINDGQARGAGCASFTGQPKGFPFEVSLMCRLLPPNSEPRHGILGAVRPAPNDHDLQNFCADDVRRALSQKGSKLRRCKEEDGSRTILVLEVNDHLTDHTIWGDALSAVLGEFPNAPDEVYCVITVSSLWLVFLLKRDVECWPTNAIADCRPTTFQADELIDVVTSLDAADS